MKEIIYDTKTIQEGGAGIVGNVVDDKMKKFAIMKAIGTESQKLVRSKGHGILINTLSYAQITDIIENVYGIEESINVKTNNFVSITR